MSGPAISVQGLSKRYRIGKTSRPDSESVLQVVSRKALAPFDYLRTRLRAATDAETLWALREISFDVMPGEVLGIVGDNGSGKSTLLKILSRITDPSEGEAFIRGQVGSLLEVGTGFHPELTGRENVYMNGAILGLRKRDIDRRFDEIVDFAGSQVAQLLDTPVKRYSSGMQVRLGFAVAAHLDPEVLLVDEVLSVGDAAFRKKCAGKIGEVRTHGRTILYVSHALDSVTELCSRAIWLDRGRIRAEGPARDVVRKYLGVAYQETGVALADRVDRRGDGTLRFTSVKFLDTSGGELSAVELGQSLTVAIPYVGSTGMELERVILLLVFRDAQEREVLRLWSPNQAVEFPRIPPRGEVTCTIPKLGLAPGRYTLDVHAGVEGRQADVVYQAAALEVIDADYFGQGGTRGNYGVFLCPHTWGIHSVS